MCCTFTLNVKKYNAVLKSELLIDIVPPSYPIIDSPAVKKSSIVCISFTYNL